jgi:UDP-glucose 4-epimerase
MTILVTGGGGYIGSHMAHALVDAGEPVVVVDNLTTGFRRNRRLWSSATSATRRCSRASSRRMG